MSSDRDAVHGARHVSAVDSSQLEQLLAAPGDLLAWVTTSWCGPCRSLAPHLDALAVKCAGRLPVVALDGDENAGMRWSFQVVGFPTLILFHEGVRVWQRAGASEQSYEELADLIVPMLDAVAGEPVLAESFPVPPARSEKTVILPAAATGVLFEKRTPEGRQTLDEGTHLLSADADLVVTLQADHRLAEPLAWRVLDGLGAGSVDRLEVVGAEVDVERLGEIGSLSRLRHLGATTGQVRLDDDLRSRLPFLTSLAATLTADSGDPTEILHNDEWIHPWLRGKPGVRAPGPRRTPLVDAPAREVADDDGFAELSAGGPVLVGFVLPEVAGTGTFVALLRDAAVAHPDLSVLVADPGRCARAAAALDVHGVPTVVLLSDGTPVWRTGAVEDPGRFAATLDDALKALAALGAAARPGAPSTPAPAAPRTARPARTLSLDDGPLDFPLALQPAGMGVSAAVAVNEGGAVEVPAGWTVVVDIGAGTDTPGTPLEQLGADDVDVLYATVDSAALGEGSPLATRLGRLRGLRVLDLELTDELQDAGALESIVRDFADLRVLNVYSYPPERSPVAPSNLLGALRRSLPGTVINGSWNALGLPEH